jgi:hypothetical protein
MKIIKNTLICVCIFSLFSALVGCTVGGSREVDSCDECVGEAASQAASEYCVSAGGNLYCSTPCDNLSVVCEAGHRCLPMADQGTKNEIPGTTQWVCIDNSYYVGKNYVRRVGGNCGEGQPDECYSNETCLQDTTDTSIYFCSESCLTDNDCVTDCCIDDGEGNYFCVPYWGYCTN